MSEIVQDLDDVFVINPVTRNITNKASQKKVLIQGDHNSEKFTFEMPRYIEGHDMLNCDKIEIHYNNVESYSKNENKGLYSVEDFQVKSDEENLLRFTWQITGNATQLVGTLNFTITFKCLNDEIIVYAWHTNIFTHVFVCKSINNTEIIVEEYADVLEAWKKELFESGSYSVANVNIAREQAIEAVQSAGEAQIASMQNIAATVEKDAQTVADNKADILKTMDEFATIKQQAVQAVNDAGNAQIKAVETVAEDAKAEATQAVQTEGTTQIEAVAAEGAKQLANLQEEVAEFETDRAQVWQNAGDIANLANSKANVVEQTANGAIIAVEDAAPLSLLGSSIYGRTTQDGTPTIEEPIELVTEVEGEIEFGVYGRNLFVLEDCETTNNGITFVCKDGIITVNGTATADYAVMSKKVYMTLPKGTYQRIKNENGITLIVRTQNSDGSYAYLSAPLELQETTKIEVYVQITMQNGVTFTDATIKPYIMLNEGDWEQGTKQTATITLDSGLNGIPVASGGNYTDADGQQWICDVVDLERGVLIQHVYREYIKEPLQFTTVYDGNRYRMDKIPLTHIATTSSPCISNMFSWSRLAMTDGTMAITTSTAWYRDTSRTMEEVNALFAEIGNDLEIVYALATPIETPLTDAQIEEYKTLITNYGANTVLNSEAAEMSVKYAADTKIYIDNKFAELKAAILSLGGNI